MPILDGGADNDVLNGNEDDDILIGGNVTAPIATLNTVRTLWTALVAYDTRKNNVAAQLIAGTNVLNDSTTDTLSGNAGRDLFFAKLTDPNKDMLLDNALDEVLFAL